MARRCSASLQPPNGPFTNAPVFNFALKTGASFLPAVSDHVEEARELGLHCIAAAIIILREM